ncbi:unnamed protein product, partial [Timema podura]|nr:unnamed protein product [Timema podura]
SVHLALGASGQRCNTFCPQRCQHNVSWAHLTLAIMAEGKQHALAVGLTSLSTEEIAKVNKGIGVENYHYLNDGLWQMKPVK